MNEISIKQYLADPCRTLATAFWKEAHFPKPQGLQIFHADDAPTGFAKDATSYFRLIHHLQNIPNTTLPAHFALRNVILPQEAATAAEIINQSYPDMAQTAERVISWTNYPVFDKDLWLFIWDETTNSPAALGIADFDSSIGEGSLEWIQVLPEYRGRGLGQNIVTGLLTRLKNKAKFATVSGQKDNPSDPEGLYRKCGFTGSDIWYVKFSREMDI